MRLQVAIVLTAVLALLLGACDFLDSGGPVPPAQENRIPIDDITVEAPTLTLNPSGRTPLSARLTLKTVNPAQVSISVLGPAPVRHRFAGLTTEHSYPILGLYPGQENRVAVRIDDPGNGFSEDTLSISTESLPEDFPEIGIVYADVPRMTSGWTLSGLSLSIDDTWRTMPILYDTNGDIRWYIDLSFLGGLSVPIKRLANGNLIAGYGPDIYELDMLGMEINHWRLDGYSQHHEITEKPGGNLLVAVDVAGRSTIEDHILELDRITGSIVREWDIREFLDVDRGAFIDNNHDWFHMNAIFYDAVDDALIVSGRHQGVMKISAENELVWILAPHKGWGRAGVNGNGFETSDYLLTAVDADGSAYADEVQLGDRDASDFSWAWGQHAPLILPNGDLFLFDNGFHRNYLDAGPRYSRGVQYRIDEEDMTVRQVWEYGSHRGSPYYSAIISDVDYLSETGNRLIMPGLVDEPASHALVTEVTFPEKEVVFEAVLRFNNRSGAGQSRMGIVYRSQRLPLYPTRYRRLPANAILRAANQLSMFGR